MSFARLPYNQSLALLTDLYELTMSYAYWKCGLHDRESVFHLFFRKHPFDGGFTLACGLRDAMDFLSHFSFNASDIEYLGTLKGQDGTPLFDAAFLKFLGEMEFRCDVDAIPEGTVVFPHEPLVRVRGPILQCQILETVLLNLINFQSLIATKAARVCSAANWDPVFEFGLRRAQGIDGALAASRAAYVGGCSGTSNVLAGKLYGIPVKGTHAHSWVMSFDDELEAFRRYAEALPNNCIFLVDTYETLEGVRKAIQVGKWLREKGHHMTGVRIDSGDLAYLSVQARRLLDEAGFEDAKIVASNELDEWVIESLRDQGAMINLWGVGTKLVTGHGQAALGGVYKLSAVRTPDGKGWQYKVKLSEQSLKVSNPGILQIKRFFENGEAVADMIYDQGTDLSGECTMIDPFDATRQKKIPDGKAGEDLLIPVFRKGRCVYDAPPIDEVRDEARRGLESFHSGIRRFVNPHRYPVGLEKSLFDLKNEIILKTREANP